MKLIRQYENSYPDAVGSFMATEQNFRRVSGYSDLWMSAVGLGKTEKTQVLQCAGGKPGVGGAVDSSTNSELPTTLGTTPYPGDSAGFGLGATAQN
jgi:hypothetical protein